MVWQSALPVTKPWAGRWPRSHIPSRANGRGRLPEAARLVTAEPRGYAADTGDQHSLRQPFTMTSELAFMMAIGIAALCGAATGRIFALEAEDRRTAVLA